MLDVKIDPEIQAMNVLTLETGNKSVSKLAKRIAELKQDYLIVCHELKARRNEAKEYQQANEKIAINNVVSTLETAIKKHMDIDEVTLHKILNDIFTEQETQTNEKN